MSMADTTWYVVGNTESEFDRFNKAIAEKGRYSYKDSYKPYFKHDPHINDTPMTVAQFCQMI